MLPLKSLFFPGTILLLGLSISAQSAEIYQTKDADGNVVFSDQHSDEAEVVELSETMSYTPPPEVPNLSLPEESTDAETDFQYSELIITSPAGDETIRSNSGDFQVAFSLNPTLQSNHSVVLLMDGNNMHTSKSVAPVNLPNVDRGTHSILVQIIDDESGAVLLASNSVSVSILRHALPRPTHF
jgi:hypothetical protein